MLPTTVPRCKRSVYPSPPVNLSIVPLLSVSNYYLKNKQLLRSPNSPLYHPICIWQLDSINIKGLDQGTHVGRLAQLVAAECELIDLERLAEVEQLLLFLKTRKLSKPGFEGMGAGRGRRGGRGVREERG